MAIAHHIATFQHAAVWFGLISAPLTVVGVLLAMWQVRLALGAAKDVATATEAASDAATDAIRRLASNHLLVLMRQLRDLERELREAVELKDERGVRQLLIRWRDSASWTHGVLQSVPGVDMTLVQQLTASCAQAVQADDQLDFANGSPSPSLTDSLRSVADVCDRIGSVGGSLASSLGQRTTQSIDIMRAQHETSLLYDDAIYAFEEEAAGNEIWIATSDLTKDLPRGTAGRSFFEVVKNNVTKRHIVYRYLLRDDPVLRERVTREFQPLFPRRSRSRLKFYFLDETQWAQLPYTDGDFGIYNPTGSPPEVPVDAYFALPNTGRTFWGKADPERAERWRQKVSELLKELGE